MVYGVVTKVKETKQKIAKLIDRVLSNSYPVNNAIVTADRDSYTSFLGWIKKDYPQVTEKINNANYNWLLWFSYWLGREHGRETVLRNMRIYLNKDRIGIVRAFLISAWLI